MSSNIDKQIVRILGWHRESGHWVDRESYVVDDELKQLRQSILADLEGMAKQYTTSTEKIEGIELDWGYEKAVPLSAIRKYMLGDGE